MSVASEIAAYKVTVVNDITSKTLINTISPENVGDADTDLADLIKPWLELIEAGGGDIEGETYAPTTEGANTDVWYRISGGQFYVYRKESGTWVAKVNLTLGYVLPDGPISIRASITGFDVTVTSGSWVYSNVVYNKATQTFITLNAADLNFARYDLIYADTSGAVSYLAGTAASTPAFPATPANSIVIDYAIVPSSSSGNNPYLFSSGPGGSGMITVLITGTSDINGEYDASADNLPNFPIFTVYEGAYSIAAMYNNTTKIISGLNASTAFTAKFL